MGLLSLGTPLAWDDAKPYADHVRSHGITQFLNIWDRTKDRCGDELLWGDEVSPQCPPHSERAIYQRFYCLDRVLRCFVRQRREERETLAAADRNTRQAYCDYQ